MTFSLFEVFFAEEKVVSDHLFRLSHRGLRPFQGNLSMYTYSVCGQCSILFVQEPKVLFEVLLDRYQIFVLRFLFAEFRLCHLQMEPRRF